MTDLHLGSIALGDVAIREATEGDGRTIEGYAYRWGELTDAGATAESPAREGFARGAFAPAIAERAGRPWPYLNAHRGTPVGAVTFSEDETGLRYDGRLLNTVAARDYAEQVRAGIDGASLEFLYSGTNPVRSAGTIIHRQVRRIAGIAGVYAAAYRGATVAVREAEGSTMDETTEITTTAETVAERSAPVGLTAEQVRGLADTAAIEAVRRFAERGGQIHSGPADPLAGYGSLGALYLAAAAPGADRELRGYAARALASRALDDTVFTAGANAGLASGNLVTQTVQRIVNAGRPAITAFGGPRGIGDVAGLTLEWPYYDGTLGDAVAAQSAEKAAIQSVALDIKLGSEALITYAGGSDISYQILRRGNPSVLDAYARVWLAAWAAVTDAAFVAELETGTVNVDLAEAISAVDLTELTGHIITASMAVEAATGAPAAFVLASTTAFTKAANLIAPSATSIAAASTMDLAGLRIGIGNVPIIHVAGITAGKLIASNSMAATWYEDGPFQAGAEDIEKLGRNVAYWSMGAGARFVPAGIVEIFDVTP